MSGLPRRAASAAIVASLSLMTMVGLAGPASAKGGNPAPSPAPAPAPVG